MKREFKTMVKRNEVDIIPYISEYIRNHPQTEILIGCDSQNKGKETVYALVIGLYTPGKGAHVLYEKTSTFRNKSIPKGGKDFSSETNRLLNEVWMSVQLAEELKEAGLPKTKYIDIDINPDPKYKSNLVLTNAVGLVIGMGYKVRYKHSFEGEAHMCYASDSLVK